MCHRLWSHWPGPSVGNGICPGPIGMRWANTRTDTGSLSCSLWAQGVSVPRHWGQPEALLCAQSPPKGQTAFLLGVVFPKVTVWHEPKLPAWGQAPDPGEDAATKKHHGQNGAPVTPAGCGWGGAWPCPGHSGQLTPCLGVLGPFLPWPRTKAGMASDKHETPSYPPLVRLSCPLPQVLLSQLIS